jgi:hypothetical protein
MIRNALCAAAIAATLFAAPAFAQSGPGFTFTFGLVPTVQQWQTAFTSKQDFLGAAPLLTTGGTMTGPLVTSAPTAATTGFNLPPGTAPASPNNGDMWTTSAGLFVQINGSTIGPLTEGTSGSFTASTPIVASFPGAGVVNFSCPTCGVTGSPLSQFAATTSAQLAGVITNETGTGSLVFNTSPTLVTPVLGSAAGTSLALGGATIGSNALAVTGTTSLAALTVSGAVSGAGITSLFAAPPAIGGTTPAAITGSALTATTSFTATGLVTFSDLASAAVATSANVVAATPNLLVSSGNIYSSETTITFSATPTFDFSTFINADITLTGNITTMNVANVKAGQAGQIRFIQDSTGSRTTVFNSVFKFTGGLTPTLSTAAGAIDVLFYSCVSSTLCYSGLNQNMK